MPPLAAPRRPSGRPVRLARLWAPGLALVAVATLGACNNKRVSRIDPASVTDAAALSGGPKDDVARAVDTLRRRALLWGGDRSLHLVRAVRAAFDPFPLGLAAPSPNPLSPEAVDAALAAAASVTGPTQPSTASPVKPSACCSRRPERQAPAFTPKSKTLRSIPAGSASARSGFQCSASS